ncbi:glutaminase A [Leptolyngbya sp. Cla-17]|uniref:glutaminase A n=1 Tax=Leptolyngbya sp. Cla-17 TaxID=2803751 RepID=UPI001491A5CB|nr:glutaminase A [Leptolyngbya sp. Cla-17]
MTLTQTQLDRWVAEARAIARTGRIPDYIPRLAEVNRDRIAVYIQATNASPFSAGDTSHRFALMSVIKPFVLLFLLKQLGQQVVFRQVGKHPSDQAFHSVVQLTEDGGFPRNPMINSGAIALADLLPGVDGSSRCEALRQWLNHSAGAQLVMDEAMLASVRSVGNETNRAIAHLLKQSGYLNSIEVALDTYNHICCLSGTVVDLARLGLLLASSKAIDADQRTVNALMLTCGLYEASGEFAVRVGVPMKSGVSGALLAVIPKQGAIACYSPTLDDTGNSVAGLWLLEQLVRSLNLSLFG